MIRVNKDINKEINNKEEIYLKFDMEKVKQVQEEDFKVKQIEIDKLHKQIIKNK